MSMRIEKSYHLKNQFERMIAERIIDAYRDPSKGIHLQREEDTLRMVLNDEACDDGFINMIENLLAPAPKQGFIERKLHDFERDGITNIHCSHRQLVRQNPDWTHLESGTVPEKFNTMGGRFVHGYGTDELGNLVVLGVGRQVYIAQLMEGDA